MIDDMTIVLEALLLTGLGLAFYGLLVRPQQQRLRRHRQMLASLQPGDRVATVGGLVGTISRIDDAEFLVVNIARGIDVEITRKSVDAIMAPAQADASLYDGINHREHVVPSVTV